MLAGQGLVLLVVCATLAAAIRRIENLPSQKRLAAALRVGVIRFLITLVAAILVVLRAVLNARVFLVWVAITYVVIMNLESILLARWMGTLEKEP